MPKNHPVIIPLVQRATFRTWLIKKNDMAYETTSLFIKNQFDLGVGKFDPILIAYYPRDRDLSAYYVSGSCN